MKLILTKREIVFGRKKILVRNNNISDQNENRIKITQSIRLGLEAIAITRCGRDQLTGTVET